MRAATVTRFGGPEVLRCQTVADPVPSTGEVMLAVEVADTLWLETQVRAGAGRDYWPMRPPYVPGNGVVGRVIDVGEGVDAGWHGRLVGAHTGNENGYADRAVVPVEALSPVPHGVDASVAASLLHDGPTALALFETTGVGVEDTVLVVGASGGLGVLSVQLARARAERVVATARGPKLDRVRALHPDEVVDVDRPDWLDAARAALGGNGADVVLDNIGGDVGEAAFALVAPGGRFSGHGTPSGRFARVEPAVAEHRGITVTGIEKVQLSAHGLTRYTDRAFEEAAAGVLRPVIGQTFPLDEAHCAHQAIEDRTVFGTTLLTMTEKAA